MATAARRRHGSPRVTAQLAQEGIVVNHETVEREMSRHGLAGRCNRRKIRTTRRDPAQAPAADLVHRNFARSRRG
ncbi:MAG: IS3 family transposase [Actinomycetota bacterium]|nr:IS3 family transposase [Actinomycetota bacterium]